LLAKQPFVRRCTTSRCAAASRADYANPRRARQQWNDELGRHCSSVNASRLRVASEWQRRLRMVARSRIQTPRPDECAPSRVEMRDLSNAAGGIKDTRHASPMKLTTIRAARALRQRCSPGHRARMQTDCRGYTAICLTKCAVIALSHRLMCSFFTTTLRSSLRCVFAVIFRGGEV